MGGGSNRRRQGRGSGQKMLPEKKTRVHMHAKDFENPFGREGSGEVKDNTAVVSRSVVLMLVFRITITPPPSSREGKK